jgi:protoheme IX farnesyltransferase
MAPTAVLFSRLRPPSLAGRPSSSRTAYLPTERQRLYAFLTLMKPRVMVLAVFTALVGLMIAPGHLDPLLASIAVLAIAAGAGAAGVLNMWYDADIDGVMTRTAMRPIPRGTVSRVEALVFGLVVASGAVAVLALAANVTAAGLLAFAIFFYVVVYTIWLKRYTPHNIVIGGAAGALPPVIGWASATGDIGLEPVILFLIVFLWTPPHFWALAINRSDEYARAGVPMLPVVAGRAATTQQILIYSFLLVPISLLPWILGFAGPIYGGNRRYLRSDLRRSRVAAAQQQDDQSASRESPVRVLDLLPVRAVCGAVGRQQQQSVVARALRARSADWRRVDRG